MTWLGKYHKDWIVEKFPITEKLHNDDELDDLNIQNDNPEIQQNANKKE